MTPIIIVGALGRMGQAIIEVAHKNEDFKIVAGVARSPSTHIWSFPLYQDLKTALQNTHTEFPVILDFSLAELALNHLSAAQDFGCGLLIGTTGHPEEHNKAFGQASLSIPLLVAPNTSLMAVLMTALCRIAAPVLKDCDKGILDIHHAHKKDAPSGTAKALAAALQLGQNLPVQITSLRLGQITGDHSVYLVSDFERLELTHKVSDRRVFAQGALVASQFLFNRAPGLYDMDDVLNLNLTIQKQS